MVNLRADVDPIVCCASQNHPDVNFEPGPFYMGKYGKVVNYIMLIWTGEFRFFKNQAIQRTHSPVTYATAFEVVILSFPAYKPITAQTMNYSSIITIGTVLCSLIWYYSSAHNHYFGPRSNLEPKLAGEASTPVEVEDTKERNGKDYEVAEL